MIIEIDSNRTLVVEGPALVRFIDGLCSVLGAPLKKEEKVVVHECKALPIYAEAKTKLEVKLGDLGKTLEFEGDTLPDSWKDAVDSIIKNASTKKPTIVMVLGDIDVGKTSFVIYCANMMVRQGLRIALIDADIGQSDIGPPTCIGLTVVESPFKDLSSLKVINSSFVGATSPTGVTHRVISGILKLIRDSIRMKVDAIIIDTTGWIRESRAIDFKISKIKSINPDIIVLIEEGDDLYKLFDGIFGFTIKVEPSKYVRKRSREDRRKIRASTYRKHFSDSRVVELKMDELKMINCILGNGKVIEDENILENLARSLSIPKDNILHVEALLDFAVVFVEGRMFIERRILEEVCELLKKKYVRIVRREDYEDILVGLFDKNWNFLSLGLIKDIRFKDRKLKVLTPSDGKNVRYLVFGNMKVSKDGVEKGWNNVLQI
ncbi:MAG: Clp1/GlmU family protein [Candidatus Asgardarchaeia archaeon]